MRKRFVIKTSWSLGIESSYENENGSVSPFWYVWCNYKNRIVDSVECDVKEHIYKIASKLNEKHMNGELDENNLFYEN